MAINTLSVTDICNGALDMVSGQNIQDINDDTNPNAELCARHYSQVIKSELSKGEWSFARRIEPAVEIDTEANPSAKVDGYFCYMLPKGFSRLSLYLMAQFYPHRVNQYQREQNYFTTSRYFYSRHKMDKIPYIANDIKLDEYDTLFVDMVESALAVRIAPKIMGSDANTDFLYKMYLQAKHTAMRNGLLQMEASPTGFSDTQIARVL